MAPILQAESRTQSPHEEGIVAMVAPLMVAVVSTITALVLLVTGAWQDLSLESTNACIEAFRMGLGSEWGAYLVSATLLLFAFTTVLTWALCARRSLEFLAGSRYLKLLYAAFIATVPIGSILQVRIVWALGDVCILAMLLVNVCAVVALRHQVIAAEHQAN